MAALYRYGAPPAMACLSALLNVQSREQAWQTYMATMEWCIARTLYKDFPVPSYSELTEEKQVDNRTAEEIKGEVLRALGVHE